MIEPSTALPDKAALIERSGRPPNYETPVDRLRGLITPNEFFFVRSHHDEVPAIEAVRWRLSVGGEATSVPYDIGLDELKSAFAPVEIAAVCQCSGNRRGLLLDKAPGVQWGEGAVGNARWKGARLVDVLARAGIRSTAVEIVFQPGEAGTEAQPRFDRSLPPHRALHPDTLLAYEMNGAPLPRHNGFPVRLVVPGWTAVHWVKHLARIEACLSPLGNRWMSEDYRVPAGLFATTEAFATQATAWDEPVTQILVCSLITSHLDDETVDAGPIEVGGVAWDGGHGIAMVEVSIDEEAGWMRCSLGPELGRYAFRAWTARLGPLTRGRHHILARATNTLGHSQPLHPLANPAGYHNNAVARLAITMV